MEQILDTEQTCTRLNFFSHCSKSAAVPEQIFRTFSFYVGHLCLHPYILDFIFIFLTVNIMHKNLFDDIDTIYFVTQDEFSDFSEKRIVVHSHANFNSCNIVSTDKTRVTSNVYKNVRSNFRDTLILNKRFLIQNLSSYKTAVNIWGISSSLKNKGGFQNMA